MKPRDHPVGTAVSLSFMKILACNSNRPLAEAISKYLDLPLTKASVRRFSDMEVFVEILENVRGEDVFVIQSTSYPANDHLMELLVCIDALKRGSARRVTAVIPYYGYARQDRKSSSRSPISAKLVANMITAAGADRVLTLDLHAGQIQGFFDIPTDNLYAAPVFVKDIQDRHSRQDLVVVSPDVGGVFRARDIAERLDADRLAIIDKRRERAGVSEVVNIIGDVAGGRCILIDDIVDTAGTLCNAAVGIGRGRRLRPSMPMSPTGCCRDRRSSASSPRRSKCWSSPTASSRPRRCAPRPTYAS